MSSTGKFTWYNILSILIIIVASGYMISRIDLSRLRGMSLSGVPTDSTSIGTALHQRCGTLGGEAKTTCYSKPLDSLAALGEVRKAMGALARIISLDEAVRRDSHVFAHGIGIAGGKSGSDVATTFAMCDPSSQSGCYHGVIQAYFSSATKIGPEEVNALCAPFAGPEADRWLRFQCVHGAGHGLEMVYSHDLPKALTGCDYFQDPWDKRSCYGGAFMENIVNFTMPKHPSHGMESHAGMDHGDHQPFKAIEPKDPHYPCSIMAEQYLVSCYEMQTSVMLYLNQGDIAATAKTCDGAPGRMRYVCYQSLGRDISAYALQDHTKSKEMCALGTAKYQPWCYFGLVKNFVDLNARAEDGLSFCKAVEGENNKVKCYEAVGEQIATLRNDTPSRKELCTPSEPEYLNACLFGARVGARPPIALERLNELAMGI
jgi:hypothetical protein